MRTKTVQRPTVAQIAAGFSKAQFFRLFSEVELLIQEIEVIRLQRKEISTRKCSKKRPQKKNPEVKVLSDLKLVIGKFITDPL